MLVFFRPKGAGIRNIASIKFKVYAKLSVTNSAIIIEVWPTYVESSRSDYLVTILL